jgi:hypothetical protein
MHHENIFVEYDRRYIERGPAPPEKEGAYESVFGSPLPHIAFIGDYMPGEMLLRRISQELENNSSERIDTSSLMHIIGAVIYKGKALKAIHDGYVPYEEDTGCMNIFFNSHGSPMSISYFRYESLFPLYKIGLLFRLPLGEETNPEMVFLLEDRLSGMEISQNMKGKEAKKNDRAVFRKSFLKDYMAHHRIAYTDIAEQ